MTIFRPKWAGRIAGRIVELPIVTVTPSQSSPDQSPNTALSELEAVISHASTGGMSVGESLAETIPVHTLPVAAPPPQPSTFAGVWLLKHASPAVQYRVLMEVVKPKVIPDLARVPYGSQQGWDLLMRQRIDGTWPGGMLKVPDVTSVAQAGTILAYRRLLELGWDPESPALAATKRLLFRLLAEDNDPSFLAELTPEVADEDLVTRGRLILREAAGAALAQAGYENDPRLRGMAKRMIDRLGAYLRSPLSQKPWIRIGNQHVLPADVAPPSFDTLIMLSYMGHFRHEHYEVLDRLFHYLSQPWPRQQPVQQVGEHLIEQPQLVLGDFLATRHSMDADMPSALTWLEMAARMGFLKRHEGWTKLFDRLLDDRDRKGIWHPPRSVVIPDRVPGWAWPTMPLDDNANPTTAESIDVTFRLGLISVLSGRGIELI